jgi:integrase
LMLAYLDHAEQHYRGPDGNQTDEVRHLKTAILHVRELYGKNSAADFGPLALKAVRQKFLKLGWCRKTINARIERIRRAFQWGVGEELIPPTTYQALSAVRGLQMGRTTARETEPVGPVDDAVVDATLDHVNRHVRGLIEFQRLTGCRPTEACLLRRFDIDMSGAIWEYKPTQHKGAWRGKSRCIPIGPKAQELLNGYFTPNLTDFLFSPARATEELRSERAAKRKTPKYPSHMKRNEQKRARNRKRPPTDRYTRFSYLTAITRACDRAFPPEGELAQQTGESVAKWWARLTPEECNMVKAWQREHHWHPNQLRHSHGTRVRKEFGLEAAGAALGHSNMSSTEVYAERDAQLAKNVAMKLG